MTLTEKAASYLTAWGYEILDRNSDLLVARKKDAVGSENIKCVWISEREPDSAIEDKFIERFLDDDVSTRHASVDKIFLTESLNYSSQFRRDCSKELRVRILSPVRFFDTPFNFDNDKAAAGVVKQLADDGKQWEACRVRQPFSIVARSLDDREREIHREKDLAEHLFGQVRQRARRPQPTLWIVAAPAGCGKTRLFSSLFAGVYGEFHSHKNRHMFFPRPFPMVAEHLRRAAGPNITGLIDAFLKTDFARHADERMFRWMVDHGHALWMLDGLDEVITGDPSFVSCLLEYFTTPKATPFVLMSVRDSVLRSNEDLAELIEGSGEAVTVFELERWGRREKRQLAWTQVHKRLPARGLKDDRPILDLLASLTRDAVANELSSTPFYASILAQEAGKGARKRLDGELGLLDMAVDAMCRREYSKGGPIDERVLSLAAFREWLEEVAAEVVESDGMGTDRLVDLAELVMALVEDGSGAPEQRSALVEQIKAMPFLRMTRASDRLEFVHELLGDYLAGSYYHRRTREETERKVSLRHRRTVQLGRYVGRADLPNDSLRLRTMAVGFGMDRDVLVRALVEAPSCATGVALRNCLRIIAQMEAGREIIDRVNMSLEGQDLSGVDFGDLDLTRMSLAGSDLSFANLARVTLRDAGLESARLRNTVFAGAESGLLDGASFGGGQNFVSVQSEGREITGYAQFRKWAVRATSVPMDSDRPCGAVRQLAHIFGKFVRPSGSARRDEIDERGLHRGRREKGVKSYRRVVEEVKKWGYLEPRHRGRVGKPGPEKYAEIVRFVMDSRGLSSGLRQIADSVCEEPGCEHVDRE